MTLYRVELNGRPAGPAVLQELAFAGYGHFTSMQVRDHRFGGLTCMWSGCGETRGRCSAEAGTAPVRVQTRTHERLLPAPASLDDPPRLPRRPA